jgi:general stress protein CsbA
MWFVYMLMYFGNVFIVKIQYISLIQNFVMTKLILTYKKKRIAFHTE